MAIFFRWVDGVDADAFFFFEISVIDTNVSCSPHRYISGCSDVGS